MTTQRVLHTSLRDIMLGDVRQSTDVAYDATERVILGIQVGMSIEMARDVGATHLITVTGGAGRGIGSVRDHLDRIIDTVDSGHDGVACAVSVIVL